MTRSHSRSRSPAPRSVVILRQHPAKGWAALPGPLIQELLHCRNNVQLLDLLDRCYDFANDLVIVEESAPADDTDEDETPPPLAVCRCMACRNYLGLADIN